MSHQHNKLARYCDVLRVMDLAGYAYLGITDDGAEIYGRSGHFAEVSESPLGGWILRYTPPGDALTREIERIKS